ncbi:MAG: UbiA family prenyltransferase [Verrucomicrobiota bacterium]
MKFQQILTLARVPNIPTVWSNVLMAWVLAGGDSARWPALLLAMLGGTLIYAGGCTHNDACDAAWDQRHKPERLIPSGTLAREQVMSLAMGQMRTGVVAMLFARYLMPGPEVKEQPSGLLFPFLLMGAVILYNFRHKENPWSVVVMGACRALLVLAAAGVAGNWSAPGVLMAAGTVWAYIIVLSLLARRESRPGGGFLKALRPEWSVGRWVGEMLAAIPLVDALLLLAAGFIPGGRVCWVAVAICPGLWALCRLLQRKYAAT